MKLSDKEQEKKDNSFTFAGAAHVVSQTVQKEVRQATNTYAKPDTYSKNRKIYDNDKIRENAKKTLFQADNEAFDPYTGEKLVLKQQDAKRVYGDEWQKHVAETDHVKPLEQIFNETKQNVWNTTDDIKAAANSKDNIRVVSRKFNNPKRSRTNEEYVEDEEYLRDKNVGITEEGKRQAIQDGKLANSSIQQQLNQSALNNMVKTGHEAGKAGAQNTGLMALTMSGIMNIVSVIKGEKDSEDAIADTIKDGGKAAVTGYAICSGLTILSHTLSSASSELIQGLIHSNLPGTLITSVLMTGNTLKQWGNGKITTQECIIEIGDKGLTLMTAGYSMAVGQALIPIPVIGSAIGALV